MNLLIEAVRQVGPPSTAGRTGLVLCRQRSTHAFLKRDLGKRLNGRQVLSQAEGPAATRSNTLLACIPAATFRATDQGIGAVGSRRVCICSSGRQISNASDQVGVAIHWSSGCSRVRWAASQLSWGQHLPWIRPAPELQAQPTKASDGVPNVVEVRRWSPA
jgi:hypothetical protein